ncbi:DgyrCDS13637 [Dimorphilus gyrociliatus]|uniref:DgyrCDS13637 n=1 Tax=Dimorphilus gyrociliatus TaxID=2664684 RepID=A0A7I8WB94_9ANNE|nr:DgyrCDS13637 [Dimorphilus gyrociliatus]
MEYFVPGAEGSRVVSLQDMIEDDIQAGAFCDGQFSSDIWDSSTEFPQSNWLNDLGETVLENSDPNLLVNPQTGMPIAQSPSKSPRLNPVTIASSTSISTSTSTVSPTTTHSQPIRTTNNNSPQRLQPVNYIRPSVRNSPSSKSLNDIMPTKPRNPTPSPSITNTSINIAQKPNKYPKPLYSYSCLIALALKNSDTGTLPVSEIYNFMIENFPYFKTAPDGWKNSVRHNLSLNKCFEKLDNPKVTSSSSGANKKGCLWGLNPEKADKMDDEIAKWRKKDAAAIKKSMSNPDILDLIEAGKAGCPSSPRSQINGELTIRQTVSLPVNNNNVIKQAPTITIIKTVPDQPPQLTQDDLRILGNTALDSKANDDLLNELDNDQLLDAAVLSAADDVFDNKLENHKNEPAVMSSPSKFGNFLLFSHS